MLPPHLVDEAKSIAEWIVEIRRDLHRHPELGYQEVRTSAQVRRRLDELAIPWRYPVAETGVIGTLGSGQGPCVALRADMDALPIHEEADIDFRSLHPGRMHACGHDCHTAMLLGAARLLKARERELKGTVKLLFQPAEEGGAGGKRMRDEGALENPAVQRVFGLHVWPQLPTGTIGSRAGTFMAACCMLSMTIRGKGGHAAMPHLAVDPVVGAAKVVCELQSLIAREFDPMEPGVVSVTQIHGGEAHNVIPEEVRLGGTLRALSTTRLAELQARVREVATLVAASHRCQAEVEFDAGYPATVNDEHCWQVAQELGRSLFGEGHVRTLPAVMGGEDFAFYAEQVPGCFVGLGIGSAAKGTETSVHHPRFLVDEDALPLGSAMHAAFALHALAELA